MKREREREREGRERERERERHTHAQGREGGEEELGAREIGVRVWARGKGGAWGHKHREVRGGSRREGS